FANFVLTGEFKKAGELRQAVIDTLQNIIDTHEEDLIISRDYDSMLVMASDILVDCDIQVYSVPHPRYALRTGLHLTYSLVREGNIHSVGFHKIPHFELGTFGHRGHLNISFLALWNPERARGKAPYQLTVEERCLWYKHGFRPALCNLIWPAFASELPASVETEVIRARKFKGGFSLGTEIITREAVSDLAGYIRAALNDSDAPDWLANFFVLHTIRRIKQQSTFHSIEDDGPITALDDLLSNYHLSPRIRFEGQWFIDVGIEISSRNQSCLQRITSSHHEIVHQVLGIDDDVAIRNCTWSEEEAEEDESGRRPLLSMRHCIPIVANGVVFSGELCSRMSHGFGTVVVFSLQVLSATFSGKELLRGKRMTTNKRKLPEYLILDDVEDFEGEDEPLRTTNEYISIIWTQFLMDILAKPPNPRGATRYSYIKLDEEERRKSKEDAFRTRIFRAVAYRNGTMDDQGRAFKWLFPERGMKITLNIQGYPTCIYYKR
ncbi:hypothetical protein C0993_006801, partial [Termitomyces sp. T159_Od127]